MPRRADHTITVRFMSSMYAGRTVEIDVPDGGSMTAGAVLEGLLTRHPGMRRHVFDVGGAVRRDINVFVDEESITAIGGLDAAVHAGSEVWLIPALGGG